LEGDVVVGAAARGGADRIAEVGGVGGDVGAREGLASLPAAAGSVVTTAEELDGLGDDVDLRALAAAVLVLPGAPAQAPVDRDRPALRQVLGAVLTLRSEH